MTVIDGRGGGIGRAIVGKLRQVFGEEITIIALGTNALAASVMLKAGANKGASGENAIMVNARKAELIMGTIGIISASSMMGELTPAMARAIAESPARKILIPLNQYNIQIAGAKSMPLPHYVDEAIELVKYYLRGE